jgi:hypothetical protein
MDAPPASATTSAASPFRPRLPFSAKICLSGCCRTSRQFLNRFAHAQRDDALHRVDHAGTLGTAGELPVDFLLDLRPEVAPAFLAESGDSGLAVQFAFLVMHWLVPLRQNDIRQLHRRRVDAARAAASMLKINPLEDRTLEDQPFLKINTYRS